MRHVPGSVLETQTQRKKRLERNEMTCPGSHSESVGVLDFGPALELQSLSPLPCTPNLQVSNITALFFPQIRVLLSHHLIHFRHIYLYLGFRLITEDLEQMLRCH